MELVKLTLWNEPYHPYSELRIKFFGHIQFKEVWILKFSSNNSLVFDKWIKVSWQFFLHQIGSTLFHHAFLEIRSSETLDANSWRRLKETFLKTPSIYWDKTILQPISRPNSIPISFVSTVFMFISLKCQCRCFDKKVTELLETNFRVIHDIII